jgi:hypothetical protein
MMYLGGRGIIAARIKESKTRRHRVDPVSLIMEWTGILEVGLRDSLLG